MSFRPQYAYPEAPDGWMDQEFVYYFDSINTPALAVPPQQKIPLPFQPDAEYRIRGIQISGNTGPTTVRFWTPEGFPISQVLIEADRAYGSPVNGQPPIGVLPVPFESEIVCPEGTVLLVDVGFL